MGVFETVIVVLLVAALAAIAVRRLWRTATGRERCGGCGGACGRPPEGKQGNHQP